jgi:cytochrome oxidase assembly protein ShyY1
MSYLGDRLFASSGLAVSILVLALGLWQLTGIKDRQRIANFEALQKSVHELPPPASGSECEIAWKASYSCRAHSIRSAYDAQIEVLELHERYAWLTTIAGAISSVVSLVLALRIYRRD